ncbi:hypothetical protein HPP92_012695 [Vanilla planifolia]|uniref:Microtubule-associated protein 70-2 n=1 Tax=Vanilla planifolia TaxID=51239 RepID=A0A835QVP0_VANPL|nr:hypothetical protein HPP92_012695 [Vanilla planifolia]
MEDLCSGEGGEGFRTEGMGGNVALSAVAPVQPLSGLTASASVKGEGKSSGKDRRRPAIRPSLDAEEFINLLHGSDPVKVELNRLENEVRDKDRELGEAHSEIKALKLSERAREKAVEELTEELMKMEEKLKILRSRKSMMKRKHPWLLNLQQKLHRRVHAAQKDDDMPPIEAILAPLEAELKLARQEIAKLQDDNRALDRLTKSKEAALLEAERTVQIAMAKASMVDDLQNKNQELVKQIEICQEENKILDKMLRQKVAEVEKLSQTVRELEEAVLAGGAAANAVRDYQRKVQEMNDEMKTLDRELARAKVTANRVAVVVANEWKDANDKVMPVKQWLEDRRFMQGEMQQLRDKLTIAERAAKSEAQLKEKYHLRLKVLEEGLRMSATGVHRPTVDSRSLSNGSSRRQSIGGAENMSKVSPSSGLLNRRTSSFQSRSSLSSSSSMVLKNAKVTSKSFDGGSRSYDQNKVLANGIGFSLNKSADETKEDDVHDWRENSEEKPNELRSVHADDFVSEGGHFLRKACHEKDQSLKDKDDAIEMLAKKVDTLTKAMEVEAKKMRREVAAMEKEVAAMRVEKEQDGRAKRLGGTKGPGNSSNILPARAAPRPGITRNLQ